MKRNQETIELLRSSVQEAIAFDPVVKNVEKFELKNVKIDSAMSFAGKEFSENAIKSVLNILEVKPAFKDFQKSMSEKDWELVADKIKKAKGDVYLYGDMSNDNRVNQVYLANPNKKQPDDMTNSLSVIETIERELAESDCDYSLNKFDFIPEKYQFDIELLNDSDPIDVFTNDTWKAGTNFIFNSLNFKHFPFFERLSCSNGMMSKQFGFNSDIAKNTFNNKRLEKIINQSLHSVNESHFQMLEDFSKRLKNTNISLEEFYDIKKFFQKGDRKIDYELLCGHYFSEEPFFKEFGLPVADMPKNWKRTANSGINAYDMVNLLTWIASHPKDSGLNTEDCLDVKIKAGNLFFKESFDLTSLAPAKNFTYPAYDYQVIAEMQ